MLAKRTVLMIRIFPFCITSLISKLISCADVKADCNHDGKAVHFLKYHVHVFWTPVFALICIFDIFHLSALFRML